MASCSYLDDKNFSRRPAPRDARSGCARHVSMGPTELLSRVCPLALWFALGHAASCFPAWVERHISRFNLVVRTSPPPACLPQSAPVPGCGHSWAMAISAMEARDRHRCAMAGPVRGTSAFVAVPPSSQVTWSPPCGLSGRPRRSGLTVGAGCPTRSRPRRSPRRIALSTLCLDCSLPFVWGQGIGTRATNRHAGAHGQLWC